MQEQAPNPEERAPSAPPPDPLIGRTLDGRYRIESVLGEGGMGLVYKAKHAVLGKPFAIKVLRAEVSRDAEVMQRFQQEAQSASAIGNHHIIEISDFGTLPDQSTYFVMEFLDGVSLTKAIELEHPMQAERVVHIARQLCEALGAAHERTIVHRDLKPDNIYLVKRGHETDFVKVLDFGIAKVGGSTSKLTKAGQVFGTPHYMSPEQCAGSSVDQRTDVYALGVILYEMASGRVPFDADNLMGILTKHMYEQPIPPHQLPPPVDVPPGLEAVIMRCLTKSADARYQTMLELKEDLDRLAGGGTPDAVLRAVDRAAGGTQPFMTGRMDGTGRMSALRVGVGAVEEAPPKSKAPLFAVLGLAVLGIAGTGVFFATRPDPVIVATIPTTDPVVPPVVVPPVVTPPVVEPPPVGTEPTAPAVVASVLVESTPPGAEVLVDGAVLGVTPLAVPRPTGDAFRTLTLRLAGYADGHVALSSLAGESVSAVLERPRRGGSSGGRPGGSSSSGSSSGATTPPTGSSSGAASSSGSSSGSGSGGRGFSTGDAVIDPWGGH